MKNSPATIPEEQGDLLSEYELDYSKSRPNRFASQGEIAKAILAVELDADVAEVFQDSTAVNRALRTLMKSTPRVPR